MRKRKILLWCLATVILSAALTGCRAAEAEEIQPSVILGASAVMVDEMGNLSLSEDHPALMTLREDGSFAGDDAVTRRELFRSLYALLEGLPSGSETFSDLGTDDPDYPAAVALYAVGLVPVSAGHAIRPDDVVTREEAAAIFRQLSLHLTGRERSQAIAAAAGLEKISSSPETDGGETKDTISRMELAVLLEDLAGREPDETALFLDGCLPWDVSRDDASWAYIADAVTEGEPVAVEPGVHRAYGSLYAVREDGSLVTDTDYGVWSFDASGRYTTGNAELDGYLEDALETCGANSLPEEEALKAAYLYVKYNFEYIVRPEDEETVPEGVVGWEYERALRFFRYGGGTCYGYAAAFGLLARMLGQNAYIVSATVNQYYGPHGFVVIPEDGTNWIYDVEMEATRPERHDDLDLFRMENFEIYNYWYTPAW